MPSSGYRSAFSQPALVEDRGAETQAEDSATEDDVSAPLLTSHASSSQICTVTTGSQAGNIFPQAGEYFSQRFSSCRLEQLERLSIETIHRYSKLKKFVKKKSWKKLFCSQDGMG